MSIAQRKCVVCDAPFYGSKNAKFCSAKCKQKDYRNNAKIKRNNKTLDAISHN